MHKMFVTIQKIRFCFPLYDTVRLIFLDKFSHFYHINNIEIDIDMIVTMQMI